MNNDARALVLIVDDDATVRELLRRWLEAAGYRTQQAEHSHAALAAVAASSPAVAICDVDMPGPNGVWLVGQLREKFPDVAVMLCTHVDDVPPVVTLQPGVVRYLLKPFQKEAVLAGVEEAVAWHLSSDRHPPADPDILQHWLDEDADTPPIRRATAPWQRPGVSDLQRLRILVVADDENEVVSIRELLQKAHEVEWAPDAVSARRLCEHGGFDVVLIDNHLRTDNGVDLIRTLAHQPSAPGLILLTGHADPVIDHAAIEAGADDHLDKHQLTAMHLERSLRHVVRYRATMQFVRDSERRFRALVEQSVEGTTIVDRDGIFVYASPAVRRVLGYGDTDLVGRHFGDFVHPADGPVAAEAFRRSLRAPIMPVSTCIRVRHHGGDWRWLDVVIVNQLDEPAIRGVVGTFTDVTAREQARLERLSSDEMFRAIFEEASDAMLIADDGAQYVAANRAAEELLGRAAGEVVGLHVADVSPATDAGAAWRSFLAQGRMSGAYQLTRPDGTVRDVEFAAVANVLPGRHLSIIRDVTERLRMEKALRASESQAAALFNSGVVNIAFADRDGCVKTANAAFLQTVGRSSADLAAGRVRMESVTPPEFVDESRKALAAVLAGRHAAPFRKQYLRPDGTRVWVLAAVVRVASSDVELATVSIDITRHVEIESALKESERRFAAIFGTVPSGVYIAELETGRIVDANEAICEMLAISREDIIGKTSIELGIWQNLDQRQRALADLKSDKPVRNLPLVLGSGGAARQILISLHRLDVAAPPLVISAVTDVTRRVLLEKQLHQAQKMEAIGRLAGGVAHDFNNLLTVIMGFTDFVLEGLAGDHAARKDIDEVRKAAQSAAGLTKQLLAFSRRQILDPKVLDVSQVVRETSSMLRRVIGEDVQMTIKADSIVQANVDRGQLEQILMNLAVNARDAMPGGGTLIIETLRVDLDEDYSAGHPGAVAGPHVALIVTDTGVGMTEDVRGRVFEPFFTTKPEGVGTGLGLATVYGIVKQSGGSIYVYSEVGVGTTFKIFLPLVEESAAPMPASGAMPRVRKGDETILLVEDQQGVRRIAIQALERNGYKVIEAANGAEAIKAAARLDGTIDLLITDVVMPKMTGREVAIALQNRIPGLRVLYMSGYSDETITTQGLLHPGVKLLHKPFTAASLLQQVRDALDQPE